MDQLHKLLSLLAVFKKHRQKMCNSVVQLHKVIVFATGHISAEVCVLLLPSVT